MNATAIAKVDTMSTQMEIDLQFAIAGWVMAQFPKKCGCGKSYTAEQWAELHLIGELKDTVERLELRNCSCGSTLGVVTDIFNAFEKVCELKKEGAL